MEKSFYQKYYEQLVGYTFTQVIWEDDIPILVFYKAGKRIEVALLRDPEGNGPGFLGNLPRSE